MLLGETFHHCASFRAVAPRLYASPISAQISGGRR